MLDSRLLAWRPGYQPTVKARIKGNGGNAMHALSPRRMRDSNCPLRTHDLVSGTSYILVLRKEVAMSRMSRHQSGFTLIELMIVVMIIAILSAIAIPQYQQYVTRSKMTEATSNLSSVRAAMEQYYQDNRTYVCPTTTVTVPASPVPPTMNYFQFVCTLAPDANGIANQAYKLTANGNTGTSVAGISFSLDNLNNKSSHAADNVVQTCWITSAKGGC